VFVAHPSQQGSRGTASGRTLSDKLAQNRVLILIYLISFAIHLPLILWPPTLFFYNTDEGLLTFSAIDRFMGVPPSSLQWPGTTLQFLFIPVFLLMFLTKSGIAGPTATAAHFATFLANSYENPQNVISAMRLVSLCINSAAPVFAYLLVRKLSRSAVFAVVSATLFTLQPLFFEFSVVALGDAVSITFALAGLTALVCSGSKYRIQLSAFLFAAALASKATIAGVVALPIIFISLDPKMAGRMRRRTALLTFLAALVVGFLFWNPYIWTDPIRYLKAFLGTALKPGAAPSFSMFAGKFETAMGVTGTILIVLIVLAALAVQFVVGFRQRLAAALAVFGLLLLPIFVSATKAEARYLLPVLPVILIVAALTWDAAQDVVAAIRMPRVVWVALLTIVILGVSAETSLLEANVRAPQDLANAIAYTKYFPPGTTLYVPQEAVDDVPFLHPSRATLARIVSEIGPRLQSDVGTVAFLTSQHMPAVTARELVQAFNDHEQSTYRELIARTEHTVFPAWNLFVYASPLDPNRRAKRSAVFEMDQEQALSAAKNGHNTAILLDHPRPDLGKRQWQGKGLWAWYRFE
jgi:hypothetical protein